MVKRRVRPLWSSFPCVFWFQRRAPGFSRRFRCFKHDPLCSSVYTLNTSTFSLVLPIPFFFPPTPTSCQLPLCLSPESHPLQVYIAPPPFPAPDETGLLQALNPPRPTKILVLLKTLECRAAPFCIYSPPLTAGAAYVRPVHPNSGPRPFHMERLSQRLNNLTPQWRRAP